LPFGLEAAEETSPGEARRTVGQNSQKVEKTTYLENGSSYRSPSGLIRFRTQKYIRNN